MPTPAHAPNPVGHAQHIEGAVTLVLDMAAQNISEYEQLAHDDLERQCAANLRAALDLVHNLIASAPRMVVAFREFYAAYKDHPERLGTSSTASRHWLFARALVARIDGLGP